MDSGTQDEVGIGAGDRTQSTLGHRMKWELVLVIVPNGHHAVFQAEET